MMKSKYIILIAYLLVCLLSVNFIYAQAPQTSYFIESAYTRNSLNPALRPNSSYIGIPFLSGIGVDYKTNTFNLDNFTSKVNGERVTFMHSAVSLDDFMSEISDKNYLSTDMSYDIFSMGFYKEKAFWNINLGVKAHVDANLPKEFFRLAKQGFVNQDKADSYNLKNVSATGNSFVELGVSYSRPFLDDNLILGVKTKLLGGIANFDLNAEELDITAGPEKWTANSRVKLNASAPGIEAKYKEKEQSNGNMINKFDGFDFGSWGSPAGYGLGFDIGAVYDFKDLEALPEAFNNLKASISFTDIGFISWSKKNTTQLISPDGGVTLTPGDYTIYTDGRNTSLEDIFDDVMDDLEQAIDLQEYKKGGRTTSLRTTMNIGLEYAFLQNQLSAGLLYSNRFGNYFNTQELTVSGNYRPKSWLAASLSYSFMHSNFNTFGGAIFLTPSKGINFFIASDYIISHVSPQWIPSTSNALNVHLGFTVPM